MLKKRQAEVVEDMDSVIEQLAEIETTAEAIVDHAEEESTKLRSVYRQREISLMKNWRLRLRRSLQPLKKKQMREWNR